MQPEVVNVWWAKKQMCPRAPRSMEGTIKPNEPYIKIETIENMRAEGLSLDIVGKLKSVTCYKAYYYNIRPYIREI